MTRHGDKILALRLREVRENVGLTQRQVADRSGIPYETYSGYERAESRAPFARIRSVAVALGVSLDYLAGLTRDHATTPTTPPTGAAPVPPKQTP